MNKVRIGFFSFTEITDPTKHRAYNEWHQLDHMPEQFPIRGVAYGQRWVSTPACRDARAVDEGLISVRGRSHEPYRDQDATCEVRDGSCC